MAQSITAPPRQTPLRLALIWAGLAAFAAVMVWAWFGAEIKPLVLVTNFGNSAELARDFWPLDFTYWRDYVREMLVTVQIALWGSLLAVIAAVPLALMAAANTSPWWIRQPTRRFLDGCRAINEMIFALLFIVAVGLGPFAGVLALFVHTSGILGKLFSEVVESIDSRPVEGIRATGATYLEEVAWGVIPQVLPLWISCALYRFESNVRSATVVGIVGGGGIGVLLWDLMRTYQYHQVGALILIIVLTVVAIDVLSAQIRRLTI